MTYNLFLLLSVLGVSAIAQTPQTEPVAFVCNYTGTRPPAISCDYNPQAASVGYAGRVVDRILKPIGLMQNFKVMECPDTRNCFAAVLNGQRYIIYDAAFMQQLQDATETDWTATSIMAHEIGHHLQGHTLQAGGSSHQKELEADRFSGFVLHQLGATLEESLIAIRTIGAVQPSVSHPGRATRLEAIQKGWTEADAIYPRTKVVTPSQRVVDGPRSDSKTSPINAVATRTASDGIAPTLVTQTYSDGKLKYRGGVLMNLRTGYGTYYYPNGDRYAGQFANDQPHGKGTYYFVDGDKFVGMFRNGKRAGYGTLVDAAGEVEEEGNYVNDVLVTASSAAR